MHAGCWQLQTRFQWGGGATSLQHRNVCAAGAFSIAVRGYDTAHTPTIAAYHALTPLPPSFAQPPQDAARSCHVVTDRRSILYTKKPRLCYAPTGRPHVGRKSTSRPPSASALPCPHEGGGISRGR